MMNLADSSSLLMESQIRPLVLKDLNKMPVLKGNIDTFLKSAEHSDFKLVFPSLIGETALTVVHLINKLPTPILHNITPYEVLFGKPPSYDHLKIFRCLTFATNPAFPNDKFSPRGVPCVFLGYPSTQKGYKLLNLTTMLTFVSRDVRFNETIFPFLTTSVNSYMHPILDPKPSPLTPIFDDYVYSDVTPSPSPALSSPITTPHPTSPIPPINLLPPAPLRRSSRTHVPPLLASRFHN